MGRARRAVTLAGQLAGHPGRWHRGRVTRGLATGWLERVAPFLSEPGLPVDSPGAFHALRYHYATQYAAARAGRTTEQARYDTPEARCMLFSFLWRQARHPLRWLPWAWALRGCRTICEYGAGAAPFTTGMVEAWPGRLPLLVVADRPWILLDYCRWRFRDVPTVRVLPLPAVLADYDGIVCTETFEHLPAPLETARLFTRRAARVVFDYIAEAGEPEGQRERGAVLAHFAATGTLTGPDRRGTYVWRRR